MKEDILALLVLEDEVVLRQLQRALSQLIVKTECASTCGEARTLLTGERAADVIFTGPSFPDGTWRDVVSLVHKIRPESDVVMMAGQKDMKLYLDAMEKGVFDFMAPPFVESDVARIVACVIQDVMAHRTQAKAHAGAA